MNNFMNKLYVKALVTANMAKNELKKMCEEDEGMDIIVTIVLVARHKRRNERLTMQAYPTKYTHVLCRY